MPRISLRAIGAVVFFAAWVAVITLGLVKLSAYAATPGPSALASANWPGGTRLQKTLHQPTLVMFVHPQCGCSRASVEELAKLVAHVRDRMAVYVLVYRPSDQPEGWEHTDLWASAAAIPGVRVSSDPDAAEASVFGAFVSGQTLVYDGAGRLVFNGGITFARGHVGDNDGRYAIESIVRDGTATLRRTPVFGCFLREVSPS